MNYAASYARPSRITTPQSEPVPESNQQVNNAGGFSYVITPWQQFERFLILGSEGGTYYVSEKNLTASNHGSVVACIKENGKRAVDLIMDVSSTGRAVKNDPAIFALALCFVHGDNDCKAAAKEAVTKVCRTGTHLFHFAQFVMTMRGAGRSVTSALKKWYLEMPVNKLALNAIKYQQRDGWSHRDVLRVAHPQTAEPDRDAVLRWMVAGAEAMGQREVKKGDQITTYLPLSLPPIIEAFEEAKTADEKRLVALITGHNLPREAIPTHHLNSVKVWDALLQNMPLTAMIRNLGKMTSIELLKPLSEASKLVVKKLSDTEHLKKSRIHPMSVLIALKQYSAGRGEKGSLAWTPVQPVIDALDSAFYLTFPNVEPIGKPVLIGFDVSASMSASISGTNLSCAEAGAALSLITASTESDYLIMGFDQGIRPLTVSPKMRLDTVLRNTSDINSGGTDCSLPMIWADQQGINVGGFIVITDSETWFGNIHPSQALRKYRQKRVHDAKEVVVGMTATNFSIADPKDPFSLDVVGFDTSTPRLISDFIRGTSGRSATDE